MNRLILVARVAPVAPAFADGHMRMTTTVTAVDAATLTAHLLAPPAGYKSKEQR